MGVSYHVGGGLTGEYHCPVLNKVFTEFTHIVAVRTTGNVFCYEVGFTLLLRSYLNSVNKFKNKMWNYNEPDLQAIKELNLKTKNWLELLTDEPFTKNDLITIQVTVY